MALFINLFIGGSDFLLILIVLVFLFGGTKIPQLMKGLGEGIKEFKKASKDETNETHPDKPVTEGK